MTSVAELEEQLRWKNRCIAIMLEIDRIRDQAHEENEMSSAMISKLTEAIEADLGLLFQRDDETGQLQLRTLLDRAKTYDTALAEKAREIAAEVSALPSGRLLASDVTLAGHGAIHCLAASLKVDRESLGALLLVNKSRPFSAAEQELVGDAISQIDSALDHAHILRELQREKRELQTIFRIDRIRDSYEDLQSMLDAVLPEICKAIDAQMGFIMLYDRSGQELELRAATAQDLSALSEPGSPIYSVTREAITSAKLISRTYASGTVRSMIGQPLILRDKLIGVLGVVNRRDRDAFTRSDIHTLKAIASQIDTAIFEGLETQRLRDAFGVCVGPEVMKRLLAAKDSDLLSGDRIAITTLFSDIRGFTNMAEHMEPELLQVVLNDHFSAMTEQVLSYEGTLDKYIGDSVMCFFNAPERQPDHALRAVRLALAMQQAHSEVIERWRGRLVMPPIGIGISMGDTIVGNFGSVRRLEYTVIGNDVNLSARLCGAAAGGQTLISQGLYEMVRDIIVAEELPRKHLKGIDEDVRCWNLTALK
jgi:class 3 adenylate cyclase